MIRAGLPEQDKKGREEMRFIHNFGALVPGGLNRGFSSKWLVCARTFQFYLWASKWCVKVTPRMDGKGLSFWTQWIETKIFIFPVRIDSTLWFICIVQYIRESLTFWKDIWNPSFHRSLHFAIDQLNSVFLPPMVSTRPSTPDVGSTHPTVLGSM